MRWQICHRHIQFFWRKLEWKCQEYFIFLDGRVLFGCFGDRWRDNFCKKQCSHLCCSGGASPFVNLNSCCQDFYITLKLPTVPTVNCLGSLIYIKYQLDELGYIPRFSSKAFILRKFGPILSVENMFRWQSDVSRFGRHFYDSALLFFCCGKAPKIVSAFSRDKSRKIEFPPIVNSKNCLKILNN